MDADFLAVIVDLNPVAWHSTGDHALPLLFTRAIDHILIFLNAHLALKDENQLAVYAAGLQTSQLLFSSLVSGVDSEAGLERDANTYAPFRMLDHRIANGLKDVAQELDPSDALQHGVLAPQPVLDHMVLTAITGQTGLVNALSRSLAHFNRYQQAMDAKRLPQPRVLILSATTDASGQYVRIMNCIFAAQKSSIPIDVCKVYGTDSVFLQQAAHLTAGAYLRLQHPSALLQYLMMSYLPSRSIRRHLNLPVQETVDLRAACFCHRKIVDIGYVCSVCLSIFCAPMERCTTCRTQFSVSSSPKKRLTSGLRNEVVANGESTPDGRGPIELD